MVPGSPAIANNELTFTEKVLKLLFGEAAHLVPDSHPNPLLGLVGSGEDSIGKVLDGEVRISGDSNPGHDVVDCAS